MYEISVLLTTFNIGLAAVAFNLPAFANTQNVPASLDDHATKTFKGKLKQKLAKDINTTYSCWNATECNVKATNRSGLYLLKDNKTK